MKTIRFHLLTLRLLVVLALPLFMIGCEHDSVEMEETSEYMQTDGLSLDNKPGKVNLSEKPALVVTPDTATVKAVGDTIVFVAAGGSPPYEWGVGNSVIGSIQVRNGNPCSYIANQLKKNSVYVKDSRGTVTAVTIEVSF